METLPTLEEVLTKPTVLILGAGASRDYGFPLWDELKKTMRREFRKGTLLGNHYKSHPGVEYWLDALKSDRTRPFEKKTISR